MALTVQGFGPFLKGVVDGANPSIDMTGMLRSARHTTLSGLGRLMAGPGSAIAMTLADDAAGTCTSVLAVVPFGDGALAVGYSSVTQKVYLYRLDALFTGWYNLAGAFTVSGTATPLATALWTVVTTPPAVTISEEAGIAFIANNSALTAAALTWPTRQFDGAAITDVTADLAGAGAQTVYALGTFSFHGHRFLWGYDKGVVAATAYRPELLRFGGPDGGLLTDDGKGTFTVGHKVRSARDAIVGACVAGEVAYIGTTFSIWPIVGYGRDSWDKSKPLDESYGFIGIQAAVNAGGTLYYWSPRGPARISGLSEPEPLWDALPVMIPAIVNPEKIVAAFDVDRDQVLWYYRGGTKTGNQLLAAYDKQRDCFLGPDTDQGILVGCAGLVGPVTAPAAAGASGPSGPPTTASTTSVGTSSAIANWVNGDSSVGTTTTVEYRQQGAGSWISAGSASAGVTSLTITGLSSGVAYEWKAYHVKNAQSSAELGPVAGSQFTTGSGTPLSPPTGVTIADRGPGGHDQAYVTWINSGEAGVSTRVTAIGPGFASSTTYGPGVSSAYVTVGSGGSYYGHVKHTKSGETDSAYADSSAAAITY